MYHVHAKFLYSILTILTVSLCRTQKIGIFILSFIINESYRVDKITYNDWI